MLSRCLVLRRVMLLAVLAAAMAAPKIVFAQAGGIVIDADGVIRLKSAYDQSDRLTNQQQAAARIGLNTQAAKRTTMRYVSLKHLENAIREKKGPITDEIRYLAGLLRVRYVFFYPESGDIVIAGPAEGWTTDPCGRAVGIATGRPVLRLDDLCVALRAFPPSGSATKLIGCSIDPTKEGLAAMQRFLHNIGANADPHDAQRTQFIVQGLQTNLGLQTVSVNGVSPKTHFAVVMVEADYRMKLIGIGLEKPPVKLVSWVDRANAAQISRNAMARWFFTPDYQCVRTSTDGTAMELVGDGVKVVGEDEMVASNGQRTAAGQGNKRQPGLRAGLYQGLFRVGRQVAGLCRVAELDRPLGDGGLHPAARFLRQGQLEDGRVGRREDDRHGDLQCAQASGHGRERDLEGQPVAHPDRRRRGDQSADGLGPGEDPRRQGLQGLPGPRQGQDRAGQGPLVVGLNR